jgi:hypothetical protein
MSDRTVQQFAQDALENSFLPPDTELTGVVTLPKWLEREGQLLAELEEKRTNPWSPRIYKKFFQNYPEFLGTQGFFSRAGEKQTVFEREFKATISRLANLWLTTELKTSVTSDFSLRSGMSEEEKKKMYLHRYQRLMIAHLLINSLLPVFQTSGEELTKFLREQGISTEAELPRIQSAGNRMKFNKIIKEKLSAFFSRLNPLKILEESK